MNQVKRILKVIAISVILGLLSSVVIAQIMPIFLYTVILGTLFTFMIGALIAKEMGNKDKSKVGSNLGGHVFLIALSSGLLVFSFLGTIPINLDRSFSVWILNSVDEATNIGQKSLNVVALKNSTSQYFSPNSAEVSRRLDEQIGLGNLKLENNGSVSLTTKGDSLLQISRIIARIFSLNPKYTGY